MEVFKCGEFFLTKKAKKKMFKKGYYGNEDFSLARNRIKVR